MAKRVAPISTLALLGAQYLTGIFVNLYVQVPRIGAATTITGMMKAGPIFSVYLILGMLI